MAVQAAAALLDELMGRYRNLAPTEKTKELNWEDPEFCKYYMVKFCPHDLFVNTRADLGTCPKVHDDEVKNLFEKSNSYKKQSYEDEFIRFAQSMLNEVERKITKGKQRLALMNKNEPQSTISAAQTQRNDDQIRLLTDKINSLVNEAEAAGIEGNVEQAQGLMKLCDQLKEEREQLKKQNENSAWSQTAELAAAQEKQMEVCEVCGAFLIVGDAQSRIDDHLMGKQHVGYAKLRASLEEIMANRAKDREEKEKRREEERKERSRVRDGDGERRKEGEGERRKEGDGGERRRDTEGEKRKDGEGERRRDGEGERRRDRDRGDRKKDDDRHSSSKDNARETTRERDRESKDKPRERERSDRDRERERSSRRDEKRRSHERADSRDKDRKRARQEERHERREKSSDYHRRH